ncbi:MAG TPA: CPBP family intramembrane glutamic endopeptidase [Anaerolineales bacterium]|nr:CPBP family intramembrane glutamic endopeptidase [Anaerolineales bacterium]
MNVEASHRYPSQDTPVPHGKESHTMIAKIDRRRIFIFVAIAYGISVALCLVIFFNGGLSAGDGFGLSPRAAALLAALMFAPTVANIATRLITREGWSNMLLWPKLRRGWPLYLAALILPAVATIVGGAIYYLFFPSRFDPSMTYARDVLGLVPIAEFANPLAFLIATSAYTILMSMTAVHLMLGEELGWRAYLLPKLMPLGGRKAVLLVGAIWAIWHWPAIFMGYEYGFDYWGAPVIGPLLFVVICFFFSAFLAWLTLRSGSVWPAAFAHGVTNASAILMVCFIRGVPDALIGPLPVGIVGSLGYGALALVILLSRGAMAPIGSERAVERQAVEVVSQGAAA